MSNLAVPITRFRRELRKMMRLTEQGQVIFITRRGKPKLVAMPPAYYDALKAQDVARL